MMRVKAVTIISSAGSSVSAVISARIWIVTV
jgi:hypothetical protein